LKPCVKRLELSVSLSLRSMRRASPAQARRRSISPGFCNISQSTKTRSPAIQRSPLAAPNHSACQNKPKCSQALVFHVKHQAQYQAFVRFAVGSSAAF
jgi:hypothetical protein